MQNIIQILIGTLALSMIHVATPHHWLPIIAISKTENWLSRETLLVTSIVGISHTASTIAIGIIIGLVGYKLSFAHELVIKIAAPLILIILGLIYLLLGIRSSHHHHHIDTNTVKKSKVAIIISLSTAMFLTPCTEIEAYYFTVGALLGWTGITVVSLVYLIITVIGMILLVYLGSRGIKKIKSHFIEHHEKQIAGAVLIILGIFTYFVEI
jgi:hypothetical protein